MNEVLETPDVKVAQSIGFLMLRIIALEHAREVLLAELAVLKAPAPPA